MRRENADVYLHKIVSQRQWRRASARAGLFENLDQVSRKAHHSA
jgi:hypothetical protein